MNAELFALAMVAGLVGLIILGIPVVISLGVASFIGIGVLTGSFSVAISMLSSTALEAIRSYVFAVIPLFLIMGELISRSGAATDLYIGLNRMLKRIPGRLAVATVAGNAVFAAVVGVSIASAASFTQIAYPVMKAHGYDRRVALGCIAGSSSLGMLIPPSILMIVWGIITEQSVGALFIAGVIPGIALSLMYGGFCVAYALARPDKFGAKKAAAQEDNPALRSLTSHELIGILGCGLIIVSVLGGIWGGLFTPTEGAGVGAFLSLIVAIGKGMSRRSLLDALLNAAKTSTTILFLIIFAQLYSRLLAMGGVADAINDLFVGETGNPFWLVLMMMATWFVMGMFIDSISIILLTIPIFWPIAMGAGLDPIAFTIIGILVIEAGIITPPFGLAVYTVKLCINEPDISLKDIFQAALPYWVMLLALAIIIYFIPGTASWLPSVGLK